MTIERQDKPCRQFKAEPGIEPVAYSLCQECGWTAYQHVSWAPKAEPEQNEPSNPRADLPGLVHTGSQNITGYRPQAPENRELVNKVKELERFIAKWLQITYFAAGVALDAQQVASARTHFEYALYHLNRAIFQPADPIGDAIKAGPKRG